MTAAGYTENGWLVLWLVLIIIASVWGCWLIVNLPEKDDDGKD